MTNFTKWMIIFLAGAAATGCAAPKYACRAHEGIPCMSIDEVYKKSIDGTLPSTGRVSGVQDSAPPSVATTVQQEGRGAVAVPAQRYPASVAAGAPIRRDSSILQVWLTPWVDTEGDFHDQSTFYMVVDPGRWLLHENRRMLEAPRQFMRLAPPDRSPAPPQSRAASAMTSDEARAAAAEMVGASGETQP